tara:strand:- start:4934 stop:5200 length:267 start_codon:yes stop_codon:yes gene_type:complete
MTGGRDTTADRSILTETRLDDIGEALIALTREIWVLTDRQMVLEAVLQDQGIDTSLVDHFQPDGELAAKMETRRTLIINNLLTALRAQ